jgi:histidine triad (HIT) family protein
MASIFTKIINGELPSYKIHEDEFTYSFLALDQVNPGHTLVVPKIEVNSFMDCDEPHYSAVFRNAKHISIAIQKATNAPRIGTIIAGFEVPHFHYHLIPAWSIPDLNFARAKKLSAEEMLKLQKNIISNLKI